MGCILAIQFLPAELWESWQQVFSDREEWFMWFIKENQRSFPGLRLLFGRPPEEQLFDQQQRGRFSRWGTTLAIQLQEM